MIEEYEQLVIIRYLLNMLSSKRITVKTFEEFCSNVERTMPFLGIDTDQYEQELNEFDEFQCSVRDKSHTRKTFKSTLSTMIMMLRKREQDMADVELGTIAKNIMELSHDLRFDETEEQFFGLILRHSMHEQFTNIANGLTREHISVYDLCATCLDVQWNILANKIRPNSRLITSGAINLSNRSSGTDIDDRFEIADLISVAMQRAAASMEKVQNYLLGIPTTASLQWDDFNHLGQKKEQLSVFIKKAVDSKLSGINILLWGAPGTGKTEFCKTLAAHLDLQLYALGETDDEGNEPNRNERINTFQIAQNVLSHQNNNLLLFDEMDDIIENKSFASLFGMRNSSGSKVYINRLFENNLVPTLWTINDVSQLDETIIRRMSLAIELKVPPVAAREKIWQRLMVKHGMELPQKELRELANLDISPAIANNAIRFAKHAGGALEDFQFATSGIIHAMRGTQAPVKATTICTYIPQLTNSEIDLGKLTGQLSTTKAKNFSLCLYGPPGTGKSEYVRYLADKLGMPVLFKRASDLLSKWVGESEENIANAFKEAVENESFLVFDEADSLLGDRRYANASWQITQVNEMLTWMESHPLPFACTTNLKDHLDPASMRRFTFKCHFDYMSHDQVQKSFKHFFNKNLPKGNDLDLQQLTPGDFAVVHKKALILDVLDDVVTLIDLLKQEISCKDLLLSNPIGFTAC